MKRKFITYVFSISVILFSCGLIFETRAATCTVNALTDTGTGSGGAGGSGDLRYCINQTNASSGADTAFVAVTGTVALTSSLPVITDSLIIHGGGQNDFVIDGGNIAGISPFSVNASASVSVTINNMTITRGNSSNPNGGAISLRGGATLAISEITIDNNTTLAENGGGIFVSASVLRVFNSRIINNHMSAPGSAGAGIGMFGGSLLMRGTTVCGNTLPNSSDIGGAGINLFQVSVARIEYSTISGNVNGNYGAGIQNNSGTLRMSNVTVSNNLGGVQAAGVANVGGNTLLRNCTIAGNSVSRFGGGIYNVGNGAVLTLANTIVANNTAGIDADDIFNFATLTRLGKNIVKTPVVNSATLNGAGTIVNADPLLLPLRNIGGQVPVQALNIGSPAIDAADGNEAVDTQDSPFPLLFDARGTPFPRQVQKFVDIGAYESPLPGSRFSVGGKVSGNGKPLRGTLLAVMTDLTTSEQKVIAVRPSGTYKFTDIPYGDTIKIEIKSKSGVFVSQTTAVGGDIGDLNFIASPARAGKNVTTLSSSATMPPLLKKEGSF